MKQIKPCVIALCAITLTACNQRFSRPDTSGIDVQITVDPFYKELFSKQDNSARLKAERLLNTYGNYFSEYCQYELRIGSPTDTTEQEIFISEFNRFLSIPENQEVIATCDSVFARQRKLNEQLSDAFSCFRYFFPEKNVPSIKMHFSGFNNKMFVTTDSASLSLSIEHYLGSQCRYYQMLEMPQYARQNKNPDNIVSDLMKAWLYATFPCQSPKDDVLTALIYQGSILYALNRCMPDISDCQLFGFAKEQLEWCQKYEKQMWGTLAEQKLLYSTNPLDRNKLVNETPFTVFFSNDSPGRAALYCAFNIVCSYMNHHPEQTLQSLLESTDAQQLLLEARYQP